MKGCLNIEPPLPPLPSSRSCSKRQTTSVFFLFAAQILFFKSSRNYQYSRPCIIETAFFVTLTTSQGIESQQMSKFW